LSNNLGLSGAQPERQVRFAPIYTGRWYSGIWTNRSPLRDANTTRIVEKFYGQAGDALIAGSNVEITNKLTLARRPGTSVYDSNTWNAPDRFYEFRLFNASTEDIIVMIDQANAIYNNTGGTKNLVFTKSSNAGQAYMQSVGNELYFGDGQDNKKWLQSLIAWSANSQWGLASSPFFTTYLIDPNGNIQQLTGTVFPITNVSVSSNVLTITSTATISSIFAAGDIVTFPSGMAASFLDGQNVTILSVTTNTFTANFTNSNYTGTESSINGTGVGQGTPISGSTTPTWSTVVPSASNDFQGGITIDGTVQWTNRGVTIENWGIQPPTTALTPSLGPAFNANWQANTFYSIASVIIDTNGNLQQVTTYGTAGSSAPTWATSVGNTTVDGSVTWTMVQTAAQLTWQSGFSYVPPVVITSVASPISGSVVYTGIITGGASNAFAGKTFLVTGFPDLVNNGVFTCSASTSTTLTLANPNAIAQNGLEVTEACEWLSVQYVIGNAAGTNCLFKLTPSPQPSLTGNVSAYLYSEPGTPAAGAFDLHYPTSTGSANASDTTLNSLSFFATRLSLGGQLNWNTINGAGQTTGTTVPFPSYTNDYCLVIEATINVPAAGTYTFTFNHADGLLWGIGGGAVLVTASSNNPQGQTQTAVNGYTIFGGTNVSGMNNDTGTVTFPTAGTYPIELNYKYWYHSPGPLLSVLCNGNVLANGAIISGSTQPSWPGFSTSYAPNYATVSEAAGNLVWSNIGPSTDYSWTASKSYTLPNTIITDTNGYFEAPFRSGFTSTTKPTFSTGTNNLTIDNPNLIWINEGLASSLPSGTISTFNGGWEYALALVNTLDNTVSNCGPLSAATGNFTGLSSVNFTPGQGLPPLNSIDPQADYVAIFRTTDGQATPFLIPGVSTTYTLTLQDYILNGYSDDTPDTGLNNLISGAIAGENTPPVLGAINLTYHLDRIWYSIGNAIYWTTGPSTPVGNGVNGTAPANTSTLPSLVKRIVPTTSGVLIFTVSDVYIVTGSGTSQSPIQPPLPLLPGIGLLNYNALDMNGPTIGLFTTDNQFIILDPSSGTSYAGFPIGDQLRLNNGNPGQSWNPANVYVAWHVEGEDQGWYVCDGANGWYRLMSTPAPETGYTWSPFATITNGAKAVQSVEISPGVHKLLIGPTGSGNILKRDLTVFTDNGTAYAANAIIGSAVLTQPGQVAIVDNITLDSVRVGTPLTIGVIVDEAFPYYTGPVEILRRWEFDPPNLTRSTSLYSQRFYLNELEDNAAVMRHCQVQIIFSPYDTVQNELLTMTIFGAYNQEI
jgi:hypothetical protein